ncbi:MAG: class I SAM-dependent methyltransferase [Thermoplasmata archaeon]
MRNDSISVVSRQLGISKTEFHQNYESIGRAMIIRRENLFRKEEEYFGRLMLSSFKLWAVYRYTGIRDYKRIPEVRLISGIHTEVVQREDGTLYKMDPEKVMFSKGNKRERHILAEMVHEDETVLDMFSGIGYFSIPVSFKVKRIYSCEINPDSFHYLLMNMRMNGVRNMVPMLGDSYSIPMKEFSDRIIMGHFDSHKYLQKAFLYLKREGKIHLHALARRGDYASLVEKYGNYEFVSGVNVRKVKSYSPSQDHVVLDLDVKKH